MTRPAGRHVTAHGYSDCDGVKLISIEGALHFHDRILPRLLSFWKKFHPQELDLDSRHFRKNFATRLSRAVRHSKRSSPNSANLDCLHLHEHSTTELGLVCRHRTACITRWTVAFFFLQSRVGLVLGRNSIWAASQSTLPSSGFRSIRHSLACQPTAEILIRRRFTRCRHAQSSDREIRDGRGARARCHATPTQQKVSVDPGEERRRCVRATGKHMVGRKYATGSRDRRPRNRQAPGIAEAKTDRRELIACQSCHDSEEYTTALARRRVSLSPLNGLFRMTDYSPLGKNVHFRTSIINVGISHILVLFIGTMSSRNWTISVNRSVKRRPWHIVIPLERTWACVVQAV